MLPLTQLPAWSQFKHAVEQAQPQPEQRHIIEAVGLTLDFSGQRQSETLQQAAALLLEQREFKKQREALLGGDIVNPTEKRAAWHTLLRAPATSAEVMAERQRVNAFIREADTARRWRNIVHIGIGGSDWGVRLSVNAFGYTKLWRTVRFIANIDGHAVEAGLADLNPMTP